MELFTIHLKSATQYEKIDKVLSFVGEDASGQFGILAHHSRMMTCLKFGLAWFRDENQETEYLPYQVPWFISLTINCILRHDIMCAIKNTKPYKRSWRKNYIGKKTTYCALKKACIVWMKKC